MVDHKFPQFPQTTLKKFPQFPQSPLGIEGTTRDGQPATIFTYDGWDDVIREAIKLDPYDEQGLIGLVHGLRLMGARLVDKGDHYEFRNGAIEADEWYIIAGRWYEPRRALMTKILSAAKATATKGH